jgi:hypothetical protein
MLPAERRQVWQKLVGDDFTLAPKRVDGAPEVDGVPEGQK